LNGFLRRVLFCAYRRRRFGDFELGRGVGDGADSSISRAGKKGNIHMKSRIDERTEKKGLRGADILDYPSVVEKLADQQKLPETKARAIVRDLIGIVAEGLKSGKAVRIGGLGVLRVRDRKAGAVAPGGEEAQNAGKRVVLSPAKKFNISIDLE
jgi:nucleoid DNA-binding protein